MIHLSVRRQNVRKNAIFSKKTKQFRAMVSCNNLLEVVQWAF